VSTTNDATTSGEAQAAAMTATSPPATHGAGFWRSVLRGATWTLVAVVMVVLALATVVPIAMGGVPLTVLSGSMSPALKAGDLIVIRPVATEDIQVGDVIAYHPFPDDPTLITHRVIAERVIPGQASGFLTRGDANGATDDPVNAEQVAGVLVYSVPKVGYASNFVNTHRSELLVVVAGVLVVVAAGYAVDGVRRRASRSTT
jgi:signal peptidase I